MDSNPNQRRRSRSRTHKKSRRRGKGGKTTGSLINHGSKKPQGIPLPSFEKGIIQAKPKEDFSAYDQKPPERKYIAMFFDTFVIAKAQKEKIHTACSHCDQLNVIIKAEGNMDDPDLLEIDPKVKVFAGEAWYLIHTRRMEDDKWYESLQE